LPYRQGRNKRKRKGKREMGVTTTGREKARKGKTGKKRKKKRGRKGKKIKGERKFDFGVGIDFL
jgi:hypothetical protein